MNEHPSSQHKETDPDLSQKVYILNSHLDGEFITAMDITPDIASDKTMISLSAIQEKLNTASDTAELISPKQWSFFFQETLNQLTPVSSSLGAIARGASSDRHVPKITTALAETKKWITFIVTNKGLAPTEKLTQFKEDSEYLLNTILAYFKETNFSIHVSEDKLAQEQADRQAEREKIETVLAPEQKQDLLKALTHYAQDLKLLA